jgi:hypothetical protein
LKSTPSAIISILIAFVPRRAPLKLIFLYGLPATGKFTIGEELARLTGYKLFHNHLAVDPLLSVFDFGSPPFVELRETFWISVFERAALAHIPGLIFTFVPEHTIRPIFIPSLANLALKHDINLRFIEVTCPIEEIKQRLDNPSRRRFQKLNSIPLFDALQSSGALSSVPMPTPELTLDTSQLSPRDAADKIMASLR